MELGLCFPESRTLSSGFDLRSVDLDAGIMGGSTKGVGSNQSGNTRFDTSSISATVCSSAKTLFAFKDVFTHVINHQVPETQLLTLDVVLELEGKDLFC